MSKLIILSGVAGCGKSTWGNKFKQENPSTVMVSSDDVREEVLGSMTAFVKEREHEIWDKVLQYCKDYSKEYEYVILDSTAFKNGKRMYYYENLHEFFESIELVILEVPLEVAIARDAQRDRHVPVEAITGQFNSFEEPSEEVKNLYTKITFIKNY